jgi:hypothetical protein
MEQTMRKKTKERPAAVPQVEEQLSAEWTAEGEIAGWMREGATRQVAELLHEVQQLPGGAWFEDDGASGIALSTEADEVPTSLLARLREHKTDLLAWWRGPGARFNPATLVTQ